MKTKFLILLNFCIALNTLGQNAPNNFKINSYSYPYPSVSNFIKWLDLSTMNWEKEMKMYDFTDRGIDDNGCVYYGTGTSLSNAVFSISKCPGNMMIITWSDFSQNSTTKLDALINEIEPYYIKISDAGSFVYAFNNGSYIYEFSILRSDIYEFLMVKRFNL